MSHPLIIFGIPVVLGLIVFSYFSLSEIYDRRVDEPSKQNPDKAEVSNVTAQVTPTASFSGRSDLVGSVVPAGATKVPSQGSSVVQKASDYIDNFLSDNKSYIRLSYVGKTYSMFTFGTCDKFIELRFKLGSVGSLVFDREHSDFNYNFKTTRLKFKSEVLYKAPLDCEYIIEDSEGVADQVETSNIFASN